MKKKIILPLILIISFLFFLPVRTNAATQIVSAGITNANGSRLNVRSSASTSSTVLKQIQDYSYVSIVRSTGNWYYAEYAENSFGYVHKDYISIKSTNSMQVNTGGANLNVRTGPSTSYSIFEKIVDKDYVIVLSSANGWARILFEGNKIGYVSTAYLSSVGSSSLAYPSKSLNVTSYKQYDSRWAYATIGNSGQTFKSIGCLTTGMAMVESYRRGAIITPLYMESISSYTQGGSMYWPARYSFVTSGSSYMSTAYSLLKQGKPVLIGAKNASGGQHWVVIYGYKGSSTLSSSGFLIHDPGSSSRTTLNQFFSSYPNFYKLAYYTY